MAPVIFGHIALPLAVVYLLLVLLRRIRPELSLLITAGGYLMVHSLLNLQAFPFGAATAGNLRYMNVIGPLVAILGNLAADRLFVTPSRRPLLPFLIGYTACIGLFCTFRHSNWIYYLDQRDWTPLALGLLACAGIYWLQAKSAFAAFIAACCLLFPLISVRPIDLSPEDAIVRKAASWLQETGRAGSDLLYNHPLVRYFTIRDKRAPAGSWERLDRQALAKASSGTTVLWDSHYSYRGESGDRSVPLEMLTGETRSFRPLSAFRSDDGRFALLVFQKEAP
jgi:hypothetical protein